MFGILFLVHNKCMNKIYTDIALELCEQSGEIAGLEINNQEMHGVKTNLVNIVSDEAAKRIGKPIGSYATIEIPNDDDSNVSRVVADVLYKLIKKMDSVLIVGLGNKAVVADSLGPLVADKIEVTRHLQEDGIEVSAISPSVLGKTGIETAEIIKAVVNSIKPDLVIAIDSLASLAMERVNTTIQLANTGISPGAGIGNHRKKLTEENIGCPVIAIGIPTVATLATVTNSVLEIAEEKLETSILENKHELITQVLEHSKLKNIVVTPKDIDEEVEIGANLIAEGINEVLLGGHTK